MVYIREIARNLYELKNRLEELKQAYDSEPPGERRDELQLELNRTRQESRRSEGVFLARIVHELVSRDRGGERATGHPQGLESEAYLNGTSQGSSPEDVRKDVHIRGRSRRFINYPGWGREVNWG